MNRQLPGQHPVLSPAHPPARTLMVQGTGSHVGKSVLVAGLCRIFAEDGYRVAPFKAQNMALNSYPTPEGGEIGRAQAAQARAAGVDPHVDMNPILLKPVHDTGAQVVLLGRPLGTFTAREYQALKPRLWPAVQAALERLRARFDLVVIEGAGSPAEVNLKAGDIVNMRVAEAADAPVLLVADIDRGGALAWVVGTLELLPPREQTRVRGILINKFRGDPALLEPGLDFLVSRTGVPVLGVVPYLEDLGVPEEDTLPADRRALRRPHAPIRVEVLHLPHLSNFTDLDALEREPDVALRFVGRGQSLDQPDVVILPGSKNTLGDLAYLFASGHAGAVQRLAAAGAWVVGICGGYQMLGTRVADPEGVEGPPAAGPGLGLLPVETVLRRVKVTAQAEGECLVPGLSTLVEGYEIHMGETLRRGGQPAFRLRRRGESPGVSRLDGCWVGGGPEGGWVLGTYLHGLFDAPAFRRRFLDRVRARKGLPPLGPATLPPADPEEPAYRRLAATLRQFLRIDEIYRIIGLPAPR